jgi:hypothetical protein
VVVHVGAGLDGPAGLHTAGRRQVPVGAGLRAALERRGAGRELQGEVTELRRGLPGALSGEGRIDELEAREEVLGLT